MTPQEIAAHYIDVEMTGDPDAIVAMYASGGCLVHPTGTFHGHEELMSFYRPFLATMSKIRLEIGRVAGDSTTVAFEWRGDTTMSDGTRAVGTGCDFLTLDSGLVMRNVVYLHDSSTHA